MNLIDLVMKIVKCTTKIKNNIIFWKESKNKIQYYQRQICVHTVYNFAGWHCAEITRTLNVWLKRMYLFKTDNHNDTISQFIKSTDECSSNWFTTKLH